MPFLFLRCKALALCLGPLFFLGALQAAEIAGSADSTIGVYSFNNDYTYMNPNEAGYADSTQGRYPLYNQSYYVQPPQNAPRHRYYVRNYYDSPYERAQPYYRRDAYYYDTLPPPTAKDAFPDDYEQQSLYNEIRRR